MTLSRRTFALGALALPTAAVTMPLAAQAQAAPAAARAALYDGPFGQYRITALLDGVIPLARSHYSGADAQGIDQVLAAAGATGEILPAPVNAFLLTSEARTILIDAGMGGIDMFGPGLGRLTAGLAAAGVTADDIDTVVLTHLHPDHIGGMLVDGQPVFPNAEVIVSEAEAAFWTDAAMMAAAPQEFQGLFQVAQGTLAAYGAQVSRVAPDSDVAPGLTLSPAPGHTPGHSVVHIDGGGTAQMVMLADAIVNTDLQTALPETKFAFDVDADLAVATRLSLLDKIATDAMLVAGSHLHFPGMGRVLRADAGYRFAPSTWQ